MKKFLKISLIGVIGLVGSAAGVAALGRSNEAPSRPVTAQTDDHTGTTDGTDTSRVTAPIGGDGTAGEGLDATRNQASGMGSNAATGDVTGEVKGKSAPGSGTTLGKAQPHRSPRPAEGSVGAAGR